MIIKKPPMGFNTWNTFGHNFDAKVVCEIADAMVDRGLRDAGYNYLILDDTWQTDTRDENGRIVFDAKKFPDGLTKVIDYVHSKDMKMGLYSCVGVRTCATRSGSFDYEFPDARQFAEMGVDYLKYDYCLRPEFSNGETLYRRMSLALRHSGRDVLLAACNWGNDDVWSWIRSTGTHTYRSTYDIVDTFESTVEIFRSQIKKLGTTTTGCYNDLDMMTVGMRGKGNAGSENFTDDAGYRTQFAVWSMFSSPLIIGCDVRNVDDKYIDLLCNRELIRINQDECAYQPYLVGYEGGNTYCKHLSNGEYAFLFMNVSDEDHNMSFVTQDIGMTNASGYKLVMTDCFTGEELEYTDFVTPHVKSKDCRMFRAKLVK